MVSPETAAGDDGDSVRERRIARLTATIGQIDRRRAFTLVAVVLVLGATLAVVPTGFVASDVPPAGSGTEAAVSNADTHEEESGATEPEAESGPADHQVVVRLSDDRVVTGSVAERTPSDPEISADGVELVAEDGRIVTENGESVVAGNRAVRTVASDPDIVVTDGDVIHDTLRVNESSGVVETVDGGVTVTTERGDVVEFGGYNETNFVPEIADIERVGEGETATITASVTNTGFSAGSEEIRLELVDGDGRQLGEMRETVSLKGGESTTVNFEYETELGDHEAERAIVNAEITRDEAAITIDEAETAVSIRDWNEAPAGEALNVTVDLERRGNYPEGTQQFLIEFWVDDSHVTTKPVPLNPNENATETFAYQTDDTDPPDVDVEVRSGTDADSASVPVQAWEPVFDARALSANRTGAAEVSLSADVNNTGIEPGEQPVEFLLDDEVVYVDDVALEPGEGRTVSTTVPLPETAGTYDFRVETENTTAAEPDAILVESADDESGNESTTADEEADDDSSTDDAGDEGEIPWHLVVLGGLGVATSAVVLVAYRNGSGGFGGFDALGGSGGGTLIVQNELPRTATVRVRCQTPTGTVIQQDLELRPDERRDLGSLPNASQFTVGAGVEDIAAHEEVFQHTNGTVGVVLRPEGILIADLGGGGTTGGSQLVSQLVGRFR